MAIETTPKVPLTAAAAALAAPDYVLMEPIGDPKRLFASRPASMNLTHFSDVVRLGLVQ